MSDSSNLVAIREKLSQLLKINTKMAEEQVETNRLLALLIESLSDEFDGEEVTPLATYMDGSKRG